MIPDSFEDAPQGATKYKADIPLSMTDIANSRLNQGTWAAQLQHSQYLTVLLIPIHPNSEDGLTAGCHSHPLHQGASCCINHACLALDVFRDVPRKRCKKDCVLKDS